MEKGNLDVEPQRVVLPQLLQPPAQVNEEQENDRARATIQIGLHEHHHIQWLSKLFVQHLRLIETGLNPVFPPRLTEILLWKSVDIQFGTILSARTSSLIGTIVGKVQGRI